jgi:putative oxidoreductase
MTDQLEAGAAPPTGGPVVAGSGLAFTAAIAQPESEATPSSLAGTAVNGSPLLTPRSVGWYRPGRVNTMRVGVGPVAATLTAYRTAVELAERYAMAGLRVGLGIVYAWFGALKIFDATPVADLVRHSLPFVTGPAWMVPVLGVAEIAIGLWLIAGRRLALLLPVFVAHMLGTFLVLVTEPNLTYQHGNPLMLTSTGEFVVKNLILLPAGIVICTLAARRSSVVDDEPAA